MDTIRKKIEASIVDNHSRQPFQISIGDDYLWARVCSCPNDTCLCGTCIELQILRAGAGLTFLPQVVYAGLVLSPREGLRTAFACREYLPFPFVDIPDEIGVQLGHALGWLHSLPPNKFVDVNLLVNSKDGVILHNDLYIQNLGWSDRNLILADFADATVGCASIDLAMLLALPWRTDQGLIVAFNRYCSETQSACTLEELQLGIEVEVQRRLARKRSRGVPVEDSGAALRKELHRRAHQLELYMQR